MQSLQLNSDNESTSSTENREPDEKSKNETSPNENKPRPTHKTITKMEKTTVMERYTDEDGFMHTINKVVEKPVQVTVKIGGSKSSTASKGKENKEKKEKKVLKTASKGKGKIQSISSFFKPK